MQADEIIRNGRADIVLLAREMPDRRIGHISACLKNYTRKRLLHLPIQYASWL